MPYSSRGLPATALSPMLGIVAPSNTHTSSPVGVRTTLGARSAYSAGIRPSNRCGGSTTWSSTLIRIIWSSSIGPHVRDVVDVSERRRS